MLPKKNMGRKEFGEQRSHFRLRWFGALYMYISDFAHFTVCTTLYAQDQKVPK